MKLKKGHQKGQQIIKIRTEDFRKGVHMARRNNGCTCYIQRSIQIQLLTFAPSSAFAECQGNYS